MRNSSKKHIVGMLALCMLAPAAASASDGGTISQYGVPDRIRGLGTYSGNIYAERFRGNGNYFYVGGGYGYFPVQEIPEPSLPREGAKIIDVQEALNDLDCDEATNVCLIKP
ncbi:MAG: hypothetical protein AAF724_19790 [Pseudomonadota bacterium]